MQANPTLQPVKPVVTNPLLQSTRAIPAGTILTSPDIRKVLALFNAAYETTLLLIRLSAHTDETDAQIATLRYAAFFPMMTMVIRPLAEVLTDLPAFDNGAMALPQRHLHG